MPIRTVITNLGPTRFLPYIPPGGVHLPAGAQHVVEGILDTSLFLSTRPTAYDQMIEELSLGLVRILYDFSEADVNLPLPPVVASTLTRDQKEITPNVVPASDYQDTGILLTQAPIGQGWVGIFLNGVLMHLGDAVRTKDFYFSADNGVSAKALNALQAGDKLFFNGGVLGFGLAASDRVSLNYVVQGS